MKKENVRNSKLSGTFLWFCAQVHGKVADDFIASKPSGALSWREEKRVFPPPTSAPCPRESLLARRLPDKLSLVISYVTLCTFMLVFWMNPSNTDIMAFMA